ncbi:hypothetical protein V6Z11_A06G200900 [Gossypium hirsutum]
MSLLQPQRHQQHPQRDKESFNKTILATTQVSNQRNRYFQGCLYILKYPTGPYQMIRVLRANLTQ